MIFAFLEGNGWLGLCLPQFFEFGFAKSDGGSLRSHLGLCPRRYAPPPRYFWRNEKRRGGGRLVVLGDLDDLSFGHDKVEGLVCRLQWDLW